MDTLCKPNFMFLGRTLFEKNAMITLKLASHFSPILCDRGTWNFFCILTHMDTLCKPNFMFLGRTLFEKNAMIIQSCTIVLINIKLASHFSPILCDRGTWNFFCILTHMDTLCKPNFMFLGRTLFEKNAMIICKIQSCTIVLINNFEILQVSIAFFSDTVRPRNLKFFLYINPYGYSLQTKFHVPRSHTFREKCDDNLQNSKLHNCPNKQLWNFTS